MTASGLAATQPVPQQLRQTRNWMPPRIGGNPEQHGPGLGVVGPTNVYAHFSQGKTFVCMADDAEPSREYSVLVLFFPNFWRRV